MGYIEELAAREAARQEIGRAKQAEAARVLDQGQVGLARVMADPYAGGLSQEDAYKLQLVQKAREANAKAAYDKLAADTYNASKAGVAQANEAKRLNREVGGWDGPFKDETNPVYRQFNVDPGLAAKWRADREVFK